MENLYFIIPLGFVAFMAAIPAMIGLWVYWFLFKILLDTRLSRSVQLLTFIAVLLQVWWAGLGYLLHMVGLLAANAPWMAWTGGALLPVLFYLLSDTFQVISQLLTEKKKPAGIPHQYRVEDVAYTQPGRPGTADIPNGGNGVGTTV